MKLENIIDYVGLLLCPGLICASIYQWHYLKGDPYKCEALLRRGHWLDPPTAQHAGLQNWQPPGCMMYEYKSKDISSCLNRAVFIGDSSVRQVFWATAKKLDLKGAETDMLTVAKHSDVMFCANGVNLDFIWDPFLNSSRIGEELRDTFKRHTNSTSQANLLFVSGGLWGARYLDRPYLQHYTDSIANIIDASRDDGTHTVEIVSRGQALAKDDRVQSLLLLGPVQEPLYGDLSPIRTTTIVPEKIEAMNSNLQRISSSKGARVVWSHQHMTREFEDAFEMDGLHVVESIAARKADILLNTRCNAVLTLKAGYPYDKTCCTEYPQLDWVQRGILIIPLTVLPFLLVVATLGREKFKSIPSMQICRALLTIALALCYCYFADRTHVFSKLNKQYSSKEFQMFSLAVIILGFISIRGSGASPPQRTHFLSRDQTEEWKGWMQFVILIYHYTGASRILWIYKFIRLLVASYLFMTGYGHAIFFYKKRDYSFTRVASVLIRVNLLSCLLPYIMRTGYLFYYFAPLISFWFLIIYATMIIGRSRNASLGFLISKIMISAMVVSAVIRISGVLEMVFRFLEFTCRIHWDVVEWRFRILLDTYVVYAGMLTGILSVRITDTLHGGRYSNETGLVQVVCQHFSGFKTASMVMSATGLVSYWLVSRRFLDKYSYNRWHPYISIFPILAFVILRNYTTHSRYFYSSIFAWLGRCSLETFVLQFHIWLAADTKGLLNTGLFARETAQEQHDGRLEDFAILTVTFLWTSWHVAGATQDITAWILETSKKDLMRRRLYRDFTAEMDPESLGYLDAHSTVEMDRPGHKRSKSSLALSLLHKTRSRHEDIDEENVSAGGSETDSVSGSPTTSERPRRRLDRLYSHNKQRQASITSHPTSSGDPVGVVVDLAPKSQNPTMTLDQSVRMFKLFEVLRSGDNTAITNAVKETHGMPIAMENGGGRTTTAADPSGALGHTTLLHLAIQCADPPVVEQILSVAATTPGVNVNINAQDRDGNTPLHIASMLGRTSTVQLLLRQPSVNESALNYQGRSALDLARTPEIHQQLQLSRAVFVDAKVKEIQGLVKQNNNDDLEKLLEDPRVEAVVDVNSGELATDPGTIQTGGTLLHEAARNKDLSLIQLLLLHGADPFRRDRNGKLPQDVTKDDRTRSILKKSPAAQAAQRGVQEKGILGNTSLVVDSTPGGKDGREMKGYLKKWTNYTTGYKLRWFVLEDGVLSYYKHQDDAGSACRGAINMRIAKLYIDPQDKTRFEIQGKSSVKYHLKANHVAEAKRWFWALNNAIQWTKDEEKEEKQQRLRNAENLRQAKEGIAPRRVSGGVDSKLNSKGLIPGTGAGLYPTVSHVSVQSSLLGAGNGSGEDDGFQAYEPSLAANDLSRVASKAQSNNVLGDVEDEEEYGDDISDHELYTASDDAFNVAAQSASIQLNLLTQVSTALHAEGEKNPNLTVSDPSVAQAISVHNTAIRNLQGLVGDLLKIARDRDAYWQYQLDREADVRRLWEDSMAKVAKEQEGLEGRIAESEDKRKRTKRALREALEGPSDPQSRAGSMGNSISEALGQVRIDEEEAAAPRRKSVGIRDRRKSVIAEMTNISDSDSEEDEEFFDAVDAGEVEVINRLPVSPPMEEKVSKQLDANSWERKASEILPSFKGYEDPVRKRLKMEVDNRPKISLWGILKSMIGKDMTKMTLPVSFNEPTSLLQRPAEDLEYTDLLDTAASRTESTERMIYVAAFAASEYSSTTGRVAKPFNPLLGETYEYVRPDKGYRFLIEQISHHPPIGAAWAESPKWDYFGESSVRSKFYGKSFDINPLGTWFLKLRPASGGEELYTWKKITSSVIGIITGSPSVDNYGIMEIKNWTTGEVAILDFKPRGWKASSAFQVSGKVMSVDGKTKWSMGGRWNDKIYARHTPGFEGSVEPSKQHDSGSTQAFLVWEAHPRPMGVPFNLTPFVLTLNTLPDKLRPYIAPTDTRLRPDQRAMEDGEYDFAANEKSRLEEKQRATRRKREDNGEEYIPRWFTKGRCEITGEDYWVSNGEYWHNREKVGKGGEWERVEDIF